jgi:hypothetical protein
MTDRAVVVALMALALAVGLHAIAPARADPAAPEPRCDELRGLTGVTGSKYQEWLRDRRAEGYTSFVVPPAEPHYRVICAY